MILFVCQSALESFRHLSTYRNKKEGDRGNVRSKVGKEEGRAERKTRRCLECYLCVTFNLISQEERGWRRSTGSTPFRLRDDGSQGSLLVKRNSCAGLGPEKKKKKLCQTASIFHSAVVVSRSHLRPLNSQKNKLH